MTSRRYILTIYNVSEGWDSFSTICLKPEEIRLAAWQHEEGDTTHHDHIQLYIVCKKSVRVSQVKTWFINNPHIEKCNGDHDSCVKYCTKDEGRLHGPYYFPSMTEVLAHTGGTRYDLKDMFNMVKEGKSELEIAEANPGTYGRSFKAIERYKNLVFAPCFRDNIVVNCFYGEPGTGKSKGAWEEALASVDGDLTKVYSKSAGDWWDGYNGQPIVVFDDFYGGTRFSELLKVLDRYPLSVQIKGSYVSMRATTFYFTSNTHPRDWYSGIANKVDLNALKRRITCLIHYIIQDGTFQKIQEDLSTQAWGDQTFTPTTIPY